MWLMPHGVKVKLRLNHRCTLGLQCIALHCTESAVMKEEAVGGKENVQPYGEALCSPIMSSQSCTSCYAEHINLVVRGVNGINGT